jgi:7-cyano-7-deazaguanine synthase in queuosine biosynthesis
MSKELCLVSASGGLDSSVTLAILDLAGYQNIVACHFKYGHRGEEAEELAITNVCKELGIKLEIFDLRDLYTKLDTHSMLTDSNAPITTGTKSGLKKLDAWVVARNLMFMTIMGAYAESQVMKHDYSKVYLLGGFLNLTESGHYPDNSEAFLNACLNVFKYGTLIGNRIEPLYCLSNLTKFEEFALIKHFDLKNVYQHTISCDRPIVKDPPLRFGPGPQKSSIAYNCSKDDMPACGSGLLSYWAAKMIGMNDMELRYFYEVDDPEYEAYIPDHIKNRFPKTYNIFDIVDRILLPKDKIQNLKNILQTSN